MLSLTAICASTIHRHLREVKTESEGEKMHIHAIKSFLLLDNGTVSAR